ncbi:MAG: cytochrome c3 family protein [Bacteroidota bacterium]
MGSAFQNNNVAQQRFLHVQPRLAIFLFSSIVVLLGNLAQSQILLSKHNLSVSGPGTIKATSEQEVCKFCHIPHNASPAVPLWDHTLSSVSYSQYTSSTMASTYEIQFPNGPSKLCLSCHDGTIAIGSVSTGQIAVTGGTLVDPDQSLAANTSSNLGGNTGGNLTDDHPFSIVFNHSTKGNQFNCTGCHDTHANTSDNIRCTTCHDPHREDRDPTTRKFLIQNNSASALCLKCHKNAYWTANPSAHQSSTKTMPIGLSHTGYTTVATNGCESCHKPHGAPGAGHLLNAAEQGTCDPCHKGTANGGITDKNVSNSSGGPFAKAYRHPTYTVDNKHNPVNASPAATNSPTENSTDVSVPNRHAECVDCHNPHAAKNGLHSVGSNAASNVLSGVWGLEPANPSTPWTQPTSFTRNDPATKEYQICFKCHSYYGLGSAPTGVTTIVGPSGSNITDQAMEFNVNNYSAHPVEIGLNDQTGSYSPKTLTIAQMNTRWSNIGAQTMYCSDCHGNDEPTPQGPHGSNYKYLLAGTAKYWPTNANGALWSLYDVKNNRNNWQADLFCVNCHPMYSGGFKNEVHSKGPHQKSEVKCVTCHVAVPHGSKRSRLIGYTSDPSPYNYNGTGTYEKLVITGFRKASGPFNYDKSNCSMPPGVCHGQQSGTYDP